MDALIGDGVRQVAVGVYALPRQHPAICGGDPPKGGPHAHIGGQVVVFRFVVHAGQLDDSRYFGLTDHVLPVVHRHVVQPVEIQRDLEADGELGLLAVTGIGRHQLPQGALAQADLDLGDVGGLQLVFPYQLRQGVDSAVGAAARGVQLDGKAGGAQIVGCAQRPGEIVPEGDAVKPGVFPQIALVSLQRGGGGGDAMAGHLRGQHTVAGGLADVNGFCGRAEVLPHAGGHGCGDAQRVPHGIPVLPVQISGACGGAQHTGDAAGVPAPAVQLGGTDPPDLALHLRGQNEGLQHLLAGGRPLLACGQHTGQHGHRGVAEVGRRRVVQLQLMAADAVEEGGVVGADGALQPHQRTASGSIIHRQQLLDNIGAAACQHRAHGVHDGALGQITHLRIEVRLSADKRRKDLAEIHINFLLSWDHAAKASPRRFCR